MTASIVLYHTAQEEIMRTLTLLLESKVVSCVYVVDNGETGTKLPISSEKIDYIFTGKNIGYGRAHNIAIRKSMERGEASHLVMNTDLVFAPLIVEQMEKRMMQDATIGIVSPRIENEKGELQHLCKLLPTPLDLLNRRFRLLPKRIAQRREERFTLARADYNQQMNIPYLSGCFLLLRKEAINQCGMFDERFFMYPEDIDLTRRIHQHFLTLYCPKFTITHCHKKGSYHSMRLLLIHIVNMCRYFNKWGWIIDPERKRVNRQTLALYDR